MLQHVDSIQSFVKLWNSKGQPNQKIENISTHFPTFKSFFPRKARSIRTIAIETFTLTVQFRWCNFHELISSSYEQWNNQGMLASCFCCCCGSAAEWINQKFDRKVFIFIVIGFRILNSLAFCRWSQLHWWRLCQGWTNICNFFWKISKISLGRSNVFLDFYEFFFDFINYFVNPGVY